MLGKILRKLNQIAFFNEPIDFDSLKYALTIYAKYGEKFTHNPFMMYSTKIPQDGKFFLRLNALFRLHKFLKENTIKVDDNIDDFKNEWKVLDSYLKGNGR